MREAVVRRQEAIMALDRTRISPGMPVLDATAHQIGYVQGVDAVGDVLVHIEQEEIAIPLVVLTETADHQVALAAGSPSPVGACRGCALTAGEWHNLRTATAPDPCIFLG